MTLAAGSGAGAEVPLAEGPTLRYDPLMRLVVVVALALLVAAPAAAQQVEIEKPARGRRRRSEEHTSELQSPCNLVCRLLLEKKKKNSKLRGNRTGSNTPQHYST